MDENLININYNVFGNLVFYFVFINWLCFEIIIFIFEFKKRKKIMLCGLKI